jgi:hypothetical protein
VSDAEGSSTHRRVAAQSANARERLRQWPPWRQHSSSNAAATLACNACGQLNPALLTTLTTGKKRNKANVVTFSNKHNRKWQEPNLQHKKLYWEEGQRWVKLRICTKVGWWVRLGWAWVFLGAFVGSKLRLRGGGHHCASRPTLPPTLACTFATTPNQTTTPNPTGPEDGREERAGRHGRRGGHQPVEAALRGRAPSARRLPRRERGQGARGE